MYNNSSPENTSIFDKKHGKKNGENQGDKPYTKHKKERKMFPLK